MTDIISETIHNTICFIQVQLEARSKSFRATCDQLTEEFEKEDGPDFAEPLEATWRDLKATIQIYEEALQILLQIQKDKNQKDDLRLFFSVFRRELDQEEEAFKSRCKDLAAAFRQKDGPEVRPLGEKVDWREIRASIHARERILDKLSEVTYLVGA